MTTSFPTSVWNGSARGGRANGLRRSGPNKSDWDRMVEELRAMQRVCDGFGISTVGVLATSNPSVTGHLYSDTSTGTNEVQSLAAIASSSGTWTLTITLPENAAATTTPLAFNAAAATIEAAIDVALAGKVVRGVTFTASDVSCAGGAINANPVTLTFDGNSVKELNITQVVANNVDLDDSTPPVESTTTPGVVDKVLKLSGAGAATYPNVWDRLTSKRGANDFRAPIFEDWLEMAAQIVLLESRVLILALTPDVGVPVVDPLKTNGWYASNSLVALSIGGTNNPTEWDGLSRTRETDHAKYAPDGWDWAKAYQKILTMQRMLVPLGFNADGILPTADPTVAGKLWTNTGVLTVSAG